MATSTNHQPSTQNIGHVTQVIGSTFDVEFAEDHLPAIYNAVKMSSRTQGRQAQPDRRSAAAPRRRPRPLRRPGLHRRHGPRPGLHRHRRAGDGAGRQGDAGPRVQPDRRADRRPRPGRCRGALADPPRRPGTDRPVDQDRAVRDRHQGDRPADAVRPRRQGRAVRRCRPGQDGHSHRADRPYRQCPRRLLGVRRRRRANPRRNRPVAGNAGSQDRRHRPQCHRADVHGVRPDERAAGSPLARGPVGADDGRVLPRQDRCRHAAVHRQHFPLLAGR